MKTNNNLALWDSVEKTDPAHTKKAKIGKMNITAVAPQHQRKQATDKFGPYGIGWGIRDESFDFIDFPNQTKLVTYHAIMWYKWDDNEGCFPITSNSKVAYVTQGGKGYLMIDDEYAKKVQTDALTKGLSFLGFNADIFMGRYDDNKYVNQMMEEFAPPKDPITEAQKSNIMTLAGQADMEQDRITNGIKWASNTRTEFIDDLAQDEAARLIGMLTNEVKKKGDQGA